MKPLQRATAFVAQSRSEFRRSIIAAGGTRREADEHYRNIKNVETWRNDLYMVTVDRDTNHALGEACSGGMFELSIRRIDRGASRDWRHLQQIKNQLIGKENEAVELFPAESRLRDAANQFWLYGFNNTDHKFPFGMFGRHVDDKVTVGNSQQRKLGEEL